MFQFTFIFTVVMVKVSSSLEKQANLSENQCCKYCFQNTEEIRKFYLMNLQIPASAAPSDQFNGYEKNQERSRIRKKYDMSDVRSESIPVKSSHTKFNKQSPGKQKYQPLSGDYVGITANPNQDEYNYPKNNNAILKDKQKAGEVASYSKSQKRVQHTPNTVKKEKSLAYNQRDSNSQHPSGNSTTKSKKKNSKILQTGKIQQNRPPHGFQEGMKEKSQIKEVHYFPTNREMVKKNSRSLADARPKEIKLASYNQKTQNTANKRARQKHKIYNNLNGPKQRLDEEEYSFYSRQKHTVPIGTTKNQQTDWPFDGHLLDPSRRREMNFYNESNQNLAINRQKGWPYDADFPSISNAQKEEKSVTIAKKKRQKNSQSKGWPFDDDFPSIFQENYSAAKSNIGTGKNRNCKEKGENDFAKNIDEFNFDGHTQRVQTGSEHTLCKEEDSRVNQNSKLSTNQYQEAEQESRYPVKRMKSEMMSEPPKEGICPKELFSIYCFHCDNDLMCPGILKCCETKIVSNIYSTRSCCALVRN